MKSNSQLAAKKCIFCGGGPLSKEHIWPEWLHEYLPSSLATHREYGIIQSGHQIVKGKKPGQVQNKQIRKVCEPCNNQWMSQLESVAKPIILSLMTDIPIILNQDEILTLARWITLKIMIAEHDRADYVVTTEELRKEFKSSLTIPPNFNIWIAKFDDSSEGVAYIRETNTCRMLPSDSSLNELNKNLLAVTLGHESRNIQIVTFSIGKIIVHVRHSTLTNFDFNLCMKNPHSASHQLYPMTESFNWPPLQKLSPVEAGQLAHSLTETI